MIQFAAGVAQELVSGGLLERIRIGLDFFDATISRTAAWVIGTRNMQKALLRALLQPMAQLRRAEDDLDYTARLMLQEEARDLPYSTLWQEFCDRHSMPCGMPLMAILQDYARQVAHRG